MAVTEREQQWIDAVSNIRTAVGDPLPTKQKRELIHAVQLLLPVWDEIMPLIVSDIVKAVKKEMLYAA